MGFSNHKDINQESVFWGQGQCVSHSDLLSVLPEEMASPAILTADCLCCLPVVLSPWRWCAGLSAPCSNFQILPSHCVAETLGCKLPWHPCSLLSSILAVRTLGHHHPRWRGCLPKWPIWFSILTSPWLPPPLLFSCMPPFSPAPLVPILDLTFTRTKCRAAKETQM